jgi:hypothetical protein
LRGQDRRDEQLERVAVNELRVGIRVMPIERVEDPRDDCRGFHRNKE